MPRPPPDRPPRPRAAECPDRATASLDRLLAGLRSPGRSSARGDRKSTPGNALAMKYGLACVTGQIYESRLRLRVGHPRTTCGRKMAVDAAIDQVENGAVGDLDREAKRRIGLQPSGRVHAGEDHFQAEAGRKSSRADRANGRSGPGGCRCVRAWPTARWHCWPVARGRSEYSVFRGSTRSARVGGRRSAFARSRTGCTARRTETAARPPRNDRSRNGCRRHRR